MAIVDSVELAAVAEYDEPVYEVVDGQRVALPPMGVYEVHLASLLVVLINERTQRASGWVVTEMLFDLGTGRQRRPDVAFVSYHRWPKSRRLPSTAAWEVVPDLAVEIVSQSNTTTEIMEKIQDYFTAGVRLVWVVYPKHEQVYVYESPTSVCIVHGSADLTGGAVLPALSISLDALFDRVK